MFLSGRTVLLMTDDMLCIYKASSGSAEIVKEIPWDDENIERTAMSAIRHECNNNPVIIINDMVEQHYRKERVLTSGVSILDRKAMVARKLNMAFPSYPVRAALPLKEKITKEGGQMSSDVFIFAAVPNTLQFTKTINIMSRSLASTKGMCLLPVEISDMAEKLSKNLRDKSEATPKWVVMMGQHLSGALRQVVTKNGEIALTRMSPIGDYNNHAAWSDEVLQEFSATMSYLTRFGFQPEDGLEVIMISDPVAASAVAEKMDQRFPLKNVTPAQAASRLGVKVKIAADEHCADRLHIGWIVKKPKLMLPMSARTLDEVAKPRQIANAAVVIMALSACFMTYETAIRTITLSTLSDDIDIATSRLNRVKEDYDQQVKVKEDLGYDVRIIQSSTSVYEDLMDKSLQPLTFVTQTSKALGPDLKIDGLNLVSKAKDPETATPQRWGAAQEVEKYASEGKMQMSYPPTTDIEQGNEEIEAFANRLAELLEGYEVEITKRLKDFNYVETITVESGQQAEEVLEQDFVAEVTVKRLLKND